MDEPKSTHQLNPESPLSIMELWSPVVNGICCWLKSSRMIRKPSPWMTKIIRDKNANKKQSTTLLEKIFLILKFDVMLTSQTVLLTPILAYFSKFDKDSGMWYNFNDYVNL